MSRGVCLCVEKQAILGYSIALLVSLLEVALEGVNESGFWVESTFWEASVGSN